MSADSKPVHRKRRADAEFLQLPARIRHEMHNFNFGGAPLHSIDREQPEDNLAHLQGAEAIARIREMTQDAESCFFCTALSLGDAGGTRPMSVQEADEQGNLWFLSPSDSDKNREIEAYPEVRLFFQSSKHAGCLMLTGTAHISRDPECIEALWEPMLKTWFTEGMDDPRITVIKVVPQGGYYWDTKHSSMVAGTKMLIGALIGKTLDDSIQGTLRPVRSHRRAYRARRRRRNIREAETAERARAGASTPAGCAQWPSPSPWSELSNPTCSTPEPPPRTVVRRGHHGQFAVTQGQGPDSSCWARPLRRNSFSNWCARPKAWRSPCCARSRSSPAACTRSASSYWLRSMSDSMAFLKSLFASSMVVATLLVVVPPKLEAAITSHLAGSEHLLVTAGRANCARRVPWWLKLTRMADVAASAAGPRGERCGMFKLYLNTVFRREGSSPSDRAGYSRVA